MQPGTGKPAAAVRPGHAPVSFVQEQLWFLDKLEPGSCRYNIPVVLRIRGRLNTDALQRAVTAIVRRHEILRTSFPDVNGVPEQVVSGCADLQLPVVDLSRISADRREQVLEDLMDQETLTPFDLGAGPLLRLKLLRVSAAEHILIITIHHIIFDGASTDILLRDLQFGYNSYTDGREPQFPELPLQYSDYARAQRCQSFSEGVAHSRRLLEGSPPVLQIPTDRPRPPVRSQRGALTRFILDAELSQRLRVFCRSAGTTIPTVFLAAFDVLLSRYSGQDDIIVGTVLLNRGASELEELIGYFANTVAVRVDLGGDCSFRTVVNRVGEALLDALEHEATPFEEVVRAVRPERDLSYSPIFQVMFGSAHEPDRGSLEFRDLQVTLERRRQQPTAQFDLGLDVMLSGQQISVDLEYSTDLFDEPTVARMADHLKLILATVTADPEKPVHDIGILTGAERQQILTDWNRTGAEQPAECLHELFAKQAQATPDKVALVAEDERLTYCELDLRSSYLAQELHTLGVRAEVSVAACLDAAAAAAVIAAIGVLKAGGCFVPLDPDYPAERLDFMLADCAAPILLTSPALAARFAGRDGVRVLVLDGSGPEPGPGAGGLPATTAAAENVACMLYTSGSTGKPKCAMLTHRNLANYFHFFEQRYSLRSLLRRHLQTASYSFDQFMASLMRALFTGGTLVLCPRDVLLSPPDLYAFMIREKVNSAEFSPAHLKIFLDYLEGAGQSLDFMDLLAAGGDNWFVSDYLRAEQLTSPGTLLVDTYGPTETAVDSAHFSSTRDTRQPLEDIGPHTVVPIGHPIANTQLYVLDSRMSPVPVGVTGELYIGGAGVGRGYYGRPGITAERFVPDPFGRAAGQRLYRTGDLVKFWPDGTLEILGRVDHQVQIRGFRVELGEVEQALRAHPEVAEAVVVTAGEAGGARHLVAYVSLAPPSPRSAPQDPGELASGPGARAAAVRARLSEHLGAWLPHYMIPAAIVVLERMPLSPNGKLDRKALPDPGDVLVDAAPSGRRPRTWDEEVIAEIWRDILGTRDVGVEDNFFRVGGHSLLATRLLARIRAVLGIQLPVRAIYENPTVAALARQLRDSAGAEPAGLPPIIAVARGDAGDGYPLSYAQQRLWFIEELEPGNRAYHMTIPLRIHGALDRAALGRSLDSMVERHEMLRTRFVSAGGVPQQVVDPPGLWSMPVIDLSASEAGQRDEQLADLLRESADPQLDLRTGPNFRAILVVIAPGEYLLLVTTHHIVMDGWSWGIFWAELGARYGAASRQEELALPDLPRSYIDFASWQRQWLEGDVLDRQLDYWRKALEGAPPLIDLPLDRPRAAAQGPAGSSMEFQVSPETVATLREIAHAEGATLFMVLLAAFCCLLSRLTGQEDIVLCTPVAGRDRPELEGILGCFVNTLILRADLSGDPTFRTLVRRVRDGALAAYAHQDMPFEKLVQALRPERLVHYNPIAQVIFGLDNTPSADVMLDQLEVVQEQSADTATQFDIGMYLEEDGAGLHGAIRYKTELFDPPTIAGMLASWNALLAGVRERPVARCSELRLMREHEAAAVIRASNAPRVAPAGPAMLHQLVEAQAERTPTAIAVQQDGTTWTYAELEARANRLGHALQRQGVGPETIVGIYAERSPELLVALLGTMKAGGAYLPLDPDYPPERLAFIAADSGAGVILAQRHLAGQVPVTDAQLILLGEAEAARGTEPGTRPECAAGPADAAYVIYTSGTTGHPKGVVNTHEAVCNLLHWIQGAYPLIPDDVMLVQTPTSFDISIVELFLPLTVGARIVLARPGGQADSAYVASLLADNEITTVQFVPTMLAGFLAVGGTSPLPRLRQIFSGGEELPPAIARACQQRYPQATLVNFYGPTEAAVYVAALAVQADSARGTPRVPIGRPMQNVQLYVLAANGDLIPPGCTGELHIGGVGLARGYHRRPSLTAERFIPDHVTNVPGRRLYRTGDLARWRSDGTLEILGRIDRQVKLRGARIELGEIESALAEHPHIDACAVAVMELPATGPGLVAYIVSRGHELQDSELRRFLGAILPRYMIPGHFIKVSALPLAPNGKLQHSALPGPEAAVPTQAGVLGSEPLTSVEREMAAIWEAALGVTVTSPDANFFKMGGHSLLATQIGSATAARFGLDWPVRVLFENPTLREYAASVVASADPAARRQARPAGTRPILAQAQNETGATGGLAPCSSAQERLWFLEQLDRRISLYTTPLTYWLDGDVSAAALEHSLRAIVARHEVLRTTFIRQGGRLWQRIADSAGDITLQVADYTELAPAEQAAALTRLVGTELTRRFDLANGPLLYMTLVHLEPKRHALIINVHHTVSDGRSMRILMDELGQFYTSWVHGKPCVMADLPVQYADYARWHRAWLDSDECETQLSYWRRHLTGLPEPAYLPKPVSRRQRDLRGMEYVHHLPPGLTTGLRELCRQEQVTDFMVLLTAFQVALSRESGQDDIAVGTPIENRRHPELGGLIGLFVNMLALRTDMSGEASFRALVRRVREMTLGAYANQEVPFERLVGELRPDRGPAQSALFRAVFTVNHDAARSRAWPGARVTWMEGPASTSVWDLSLTVITGDDALSCSFEYREDVVDTAWVQRMAGLFERTLHAGLRHPDQIIPFNREVSPPGSPIDR